MKRLVFVVVVFMVFGCTEAPSWSRGSIIRPTICRIVEVEAILLAVQLLSADKPIKVEMSPWPREPFWTTPIEVLPVRLMLDSRLPHEDSTLKLSEPVRGYFNSPLNFAPGPEVLVAPATPIDGIWVFNLNHYKTFSLRPEGWRRSDLEDTEVFASLDDLEAAFEAARQQPECARWDWVAGTRSANEERLRNGGMTSPTSGHPASPDAGSP